MGDPKDVWRPDAGVFIVFVAGEQGARTSSVVAPAAGGRRGPSHDAVRSPFRTTGPPVPRARSAGTLALRGLRRRACPSRDGRGRGLGCGRLAQQGGGGALLAAGTGGR